MYLFVYTTVLSLQLILTSSLRILESPPLNCTQEGLRCTADINNCLDRGWLKRRKFTPNGPSNLTVRWDVRGDEGGDLVPVLVVNWAVQMDGSIKFMNGTEVHVLEMSINLNRCIRFVFQSFSPKKKSPAGALSFSLDRVVVEPHQSYLVSVNNLPKPNIGHDSFNVSTTITIPGCADPVMKETKRCVESGSLWRPNISLEKTKGQDGEPAITVNFISTQFSEKYSVAVQCLHANRERQTVNKCNRTSLNATFALQKWPQTCCNFTVEIQPFFMHCQNDCIRRWEKFDICPNPTVSPRSAFRVPLAVGLTVSFGAVLLCGAACCAGFHCWKADPGVPLKDSQEKPGSPRRRSRHERLQVSGPRRVLLIYSLDHPLYRDIVLKLCAFLRACCGTDVVLDLLDSAWLGAVGRMQWLDWQKQQIEKSSDKILVLCSRGVRAKWRAMCGGGRVLLREDLRSPIGDMLTPALSLIAPDLLRAAALEKYIVAYFEDVSCEDDVPAPFNITIKYKLMKHFKELYFRILEEEQHEPGRVNRIEGIAQDEYFNCPSGRALRDAIEALQAYQLENPDWFEKECVDSEEEAAEPEQEHPLLAAAGGNPTFQCVPEIREGPPVLVREVEFNGDARGVQGLIPLVNQGGGALSESHLGVFAEQSQVRVLHSLVRETPCVPDAGASLWKSLQAASAEPVLPEHAAQSGSLLGGSPGERCPVEDEEDEEGPKSSGSPPSLECLERLRALQESLSAVAGPGATRVERPQSHVLAWGRGLQEKRPLSGSDQGYGSGSLPQDSLDPLAALPLAQSQPSSVALAAHPCPE